jgi:hypothetical protein
MRMQGSGPAQHFFGPGLLRFFAAVLVVAFHRGGFAWSLANEPEVPAVCRRALRSHSRARHTVLPGLTLR